VHARDRRALAARDRIGIPAAVEQHEHDADLVPVGDAQELVHAALQPFGILLPQHVVEIDAHRVHADRFGPAQLLVDGGGIEAVGLPHLELVDRGARIVIGADQPGLAFVPGVRLGLGPGVAGLSAGGGDECERARGDKEAAADHLGLSLRRFQRFFGAAVPPVVRR
jgi:hypothetical protein